METQAAQAAMFQSAQNAHHHSAMTLQGSQSGANAPQPEGLITSAINRAVQISNQIGLEGQLLHELVHRLVGAAPKAAPSSVAPSNPNGSLGGPMAELHGLHVALGRAEEQLELLREVRLELQRL